MKLVNKAIGNVRPSPTLQMANLANEMKRNGINVISLSVGEPDFNTPNNINEAAINAIRAGHTKYTAVDGIFELKTAIKEKFKRENNLEFDISEITVGAGGKQVLYNTIMVSLEEGDEVIIPAPYWVSYPDIVLLAKGKPVIIEAGIEKNFKIGPKDLEKAITPKTKWLILNSPSNPTGAAYTREELAELAKILIKHPHVNILSDDIYEHILYDNFKFCTILEVAPELKNRTLTLNGVSKAYSMTGWRIGYGAGPKELIKAINILQSQSTSNPCSISQYAALEALNGTQDFIKPNSLLFQKRRDLVLDLLSKIDMLECNKPEGAFYVFPRCQKAFGMKAPDGKIINNSDDFVGYLLQEAKVAAVSGSGFGMEGYFRISYATSEKLLEQACLNIKDACQKLKK